MNKEHQSHASSKLNTALVKAEQLLNSAQAVAAKNLLLPWIISHSKHSTLLLLLGLAEQRTGNIQHAIDYLTRLLQIHPEHYDGNLALADIYYQANEHQQALAYIERAEQVRPKNQYTQEYKSMILGELFRYQDAITILNTVINTGKPSYFTWNNLGNLYRNIGLLNEADKCYHTAIELSGIDDIAYNNHLTLLHYLPSSTQPQIKALLDKWQSHYASNVSPLSHNTDSLTANKKLRIGMVSDGFRTHPVGQMITSTLEAIPRDEIELFAYSTNLSEDIITARIKNTVSQWMTVTHLDHEQLAQQITDDNIDILFDLCGYNNNSRMRTMARKPAPLLVKWVGGLINTTGLSTIDYLLSDHVETPAGVDQNYTEQLIRLPDDYICYNPPLYTPDTVPPPTVYNGFITLGCFNNTAKLNSELLSHWATIMHTLPNSKLLLKGFQFNNDILRDNIITIMQEQGISEERLLLEGSSPHNELLRTYNKIDIALDPWPYSGGLTTCEALFMGVPVVTLPGPTFAGRHSATHLTNVGLSQLVAEDWQQYHDIVVNLASDLDNLANIRTHLRSALLESPVCDAPRFARNFSNAMRAIWQRHCKGKAPIALSLDKDGNAQFADEDKPVELLLPEEQQEQTDGDFSFNFTGRINALEHGATLASRSDFGQFLTQGAVNYICLDPGSAVNNSQQLQHTGLFEYFPLTVLGDGSKMDLRLAVQAELSSTLPLTPEPEQPEVIPSVTPPTLVSTTTANSNRIDDIEGIDSIDWLILDTQHHNLSILQHGQQKLADALLIEVGVCFLPNHSGQVDFGAINQQLEGLGFRLLNLNNIEHHNLLPQLKNDHIKNEVFSGQAVYIPNNKSLIKLNKNQLQKLAFLLDSIYSFKDVAYHLINYIDSNQALNYLKNKNLSVNFENKNLEIRSKLNDKKPNFIHLCFNNMHTERAVELAESDFINEHSNNIVFIEKHRSVTGYDIAEKISDKNSVIFNKNTDLDIILEQCTLPEVKAIFIHGLFFEWQFNLIERIGKNKKVIWGIWGGDLYNRNNSARNTNIINNYVDFIATFDKSELSFFKLKYNKKKQFDLQYSFDIENSDDTEIKKKKTIVLGNSGDPSNNHIEILITLSKITDINDYKIVMPFSYNYSNEYLVEVTNKLENLNLKNVNVMTKFIKKKDYNKLLGEACLLITAHNRQQALGNITTAISMETPVIIRKNITLDNKKYKNPAWANLVEKHSIYLYDFEDMLNTKSIKEIIKKAEPHIESNKKIVKNIFGKEYSYSLFNNLIKQL